MEACHRELSWSRETCTCPWARHRIWKVKRVTEKGGEEGWRFQGREHVWWHWRAWCSSRGRTLWLEHCGERVGWADGRGREAGQMEEAQGPEDEGLRGLAQNCVLEVLLSSHEEFNKQERKEMLDSNFWDSPAVFENGLGEEWVSLTPFKAFWLSLPQSSLLALQEAVTSVNVLGFTVRSSSPRTCEDRMANYSSILTLALP